MSVRYPAVAGLFYESNPEALRTTVTRCLDGAAVTAAPDQVAAIVSPHAGYPYSGTTAGHVFARVRGARPTRLVMLGRSHRHAFKGAAVPAQASFETPLGQLSVDHAFIATMGSLVSSEYAHVHDEEHSLEVLLPFVQVALGEVPIVPILFGADPTESHVQWGAALADSLAPGDLVAVSTDLSHYLSEEEANEADRATLDRVLQDDIEGILQETKEGANSMCGATAVVCAMACSRKREARAWRLLDYSTSARASGDYQRVVGYGAISMEWNR